MIDKIFYWFDVYEYTRVEGVIFFFTKFLPKINDEP